VEARKKGAQGTIRSHLKPWSNYDQDRVILLGGASIAQHSIHERV
jgi:hypothetical protein